MVAIPRGVAWNDEGGFSLIELLIALFVSIGVMGAAVSVVSGVQNTYQHQMADVTVEQEGRFALDWIRRVIEPAGSNPYSVNSTACPAAGTTIQPVRFDPDGNLANDDIRVQADVGIPDGLFVGAVGNCTQANEDVTIARSAASRAITRFDRGTDLAPVAISDGIFSGLLFEYFDSGHNPTATAGSVRFVRVTVTGQSRVRRPGMPAPTTFTLQTDVRLRTR